MAKYLLTDWEINGHDDSDFMLTYWDDVSLKVEAHCYASTRYGGCYCKPEAVEGGSSYHLCGNPARSDRQAPEVLLMPTASKVEDARQWLEDWLFGVMQREDKQLVDFPDFDHLHEGLEVRLLEACKFQINTTEPCNKCAGGGKWINPRNPNDKRDCFACKGSGQHVNGKLKNDQGKLVFEKLEAGAYGTVIDWRAFGTFYPGGANKPDRHNTTVQFKLENGKVVRASLKKLRLHREYRTQDSLRARAKGISYSYEFSKVYPRHAWDTHNYARRAVAYQESNHA